MSEYIPCDCGCTVSQPGSSLYEMIMQYQAVLGFELNHRMGGIG